VLSPASVRGHATIRPDDDTRGSGNCFGLPLTIRTAGGHPHGASPAQRLYCQASLVFDPLAGSFDAWNPRPAAT